jgi:hypothetical protein
MPLNDSTWDLEFKKNEQEIQRIMHKGHSHHCACRQVWGDGECECDLYKLGHNPYQWLQENETNR